MKKLFALILAFCLVLTMVPAPAFAEGEQECTCDTACAEGAMNAACPVCGAEGTAPESCDKYVAPAPEPLVCNCETACGADAMNGACPVCGAEGATPESCGKYTAPEPEKPQEPTPAQKVQTLIDALPETVTAENRAEVEAQLTAIDEAKGPLGDEERAALDFGKYNAAVAAINLLDNQPGAEEPKTMETKSLEGATVNVTKTFRYNGAPQTLDATDVTVTLEGTPLTAGTDYTVTATAQTYPGTYSFTVTGSGNYTGTASGTWSIGKGTLGDQTIYVKMKTEGRMYVDLTDSLPDLGPNGGLKRGISQSEGIDVSNYGPPASSLYIECNGVVQDPSEETVSVLMMSDYYEDFTVKVIVHFVNEGEGEVKTLTVSMESWNVSAMPNKPTVTGLPDTPYNYKVTHAKKDGTALTGVPKEIGEYQVTVSCEDLDNNTYSGTADFSVFLSVSFDPNGGTLPESDYTIQTTTGKLSTLPVPTWTGHTFLGWYTDKNEGTEVETETKYSENTTLYARWKTNTYTISFDANGGKGEMDPLSMTYGQTAKLTAIGFTRDGYRFTGWNTQADGTGNAYSNEEQVSNLTTVDGGTVTPLRPVGQGH